MSSQLNYNDSDFTFTKAGIFIPTTTGSLSFLSSLTIVTFILRCRSNTVYHRIMFCMSFFDMLSSLAIALTTIPMPADAIYPFAGPSYGTIRTCEAQGLFYVVGNGMTLCMNGLLNIYYLCILRYNMTDKVFSRYIEPISYILSVTVFALTQIPLVLNKNMYNPSPIGPFCRPDVYPVGCNEDNVPEGRECRGSAEDYHKFVIMFTFSMGAMLMNLTITMGLICRAFYKKEKDAKKLTSPTPVINRDDRDTLESTLEESRNLHHITKMKKTIKGQAFLYIGAFWLTWGVSILTLIEALGKMYWIKALSLLTAPSQGFFNMMIFFYHKVSLLQKNDENRSIVDALKLLLFNPKESQKVREILSISVIFEQNLQMQYSTALRHKYSTSNEGHEVDENSSNEDYEVDKNCVSNHYERRRGSDPKGQVTCVHEEYNLPKSEDSFVNSLELQDRKSQSLGGYSSKYKNSSLISAVDEV